jgi:hypothetical protein
MLELEGEDNVGLADGGRKDSQSPKIDGKEFSLEK